MRMTPSALGAASTDHSRRQAHLQTAEILRRVWTSPWHSTENVCLNGQFTCHHQVRGGQLGVLLDRQPGGASCNERSHDTGEVERVVPT